MRLASRLTAAALLLTSHAASAANLLVNGSFETFTGTFAGDGGRQLLPGNSTLTGWSIVVHEIAILRVPNSYSLTASHGVHFLDVVGYNNTLTKGVTQTLSGLTIGARYRFSADVGISNNPACVPGSTCGGPVSILVRVGASISQTLTHDSPMTGVSWGGYSFDFVADAESMALTVTGSAVPPGGAYIGLDNLSVDELAAVPVLPYYR